MVLISFPKIVIAFLVPVLHRELGEACLSRDPSTRPAAPALVALLHKALSACGGVSAAKKRIFSTSSFAGKGVIGVPAHLPSNAAAMMGLGNASLVRPHLHGGMVPNAGAGAGRGGEGMRGGQEQGGHNNGGGGAWDQATLARSHTHDSSSFPLHIL